MLRVVMAATPSFREMVFAPADWGRIEALADLRVLDDPRDAVSLVEALPEADVLITSWGAVPMTADVLAHAPRLRLIAHSASSVKHFVTDAVFDRGIRITQVGQAMARPVAEVALAFTLTMLHRIHRYDHAMHAGATWTDAIAAPPQHGITGSRIGVVGASRTGAEYIAMAVALGAEVVVYDPYLTDERAASFGVRRVELDELLRTSRAVVLHAPTLPETREMIGRRELALMPDGASLVNTARSWLIDSDALLDELRSGRIDAALDVFDEEPLPVDSPLRGLPNVLLTPHRAAGTVEGYLEMGELVADELERYAAGDALRFEVTAEALARMG
ncbi:phosphoglycerate dehydrogenase-like enzyme [Kribbella amoyensis]|uniref:Phosphoglycerate dehydrogenase-like enzyme n=1 Tax=Kribbella amoyensis TaxID=996641 RepID=A0A561B302_9ACTN|nr:hydroxyacid dehydrogenase [Kribbella amoyensis]TWD73217.1 phosphoglycerate dehydrogenase-like enzyme [Kribbella amoyensis]